MVLNIFMILKQNNNLTKEICGTSEYLMSESVVLLEVKVEDICGLFGYFDETGEETIKAQYKYAHKFGCGLANVSYDYAGEFDKHGITVYVYTLIQKARKSFYRVT